VPLLCHPSVPSGCDPDNAPGQGQLFTLPPRQPAFVQVLVEDLARWCEKQQLSQGARALLERLLVEFPRPAAVPCSLDGLAAHFGIGRNRIRRLMDELADAGAVRFHGRAGHEGLLELLVREELIANGRRDTGPFVQVVGAELEAYCSELGLGFDARAVLLRAVLSVDDRQGRRIVPGNRTAVADQLGINRRRAAGLGWELLGAVTWLPEGLEVGEWDRLVRPAPPRDSARAAARNGASGRAIWRERPGLLPPIHRYTDNTATDSSLPSQTRAVPDPVEGKEPIPPPAPPLDATEGGQLLLAMASYRRELGFPTDLLAEWNDGGRRALAQELDWRLAEGWERQALFGRLTELGGAISDMGVMLHKVRQLPLSPLALVEGLVLPLGPAATGAALAAQELEAAAQRRAQAFRALARTRALVLEVDPVDIVRELQAEAPSPELLREGLELLRDEAGPGPMADAATAALEAAPPEPEADPEERARGFVRFALDQGGDPDDVRQSVLSLFEGRALYEGLALLEEAAPGSVAGAPPVPVSVEQLAGGALEGKPSGLVVVGLDVAEHHGHVPPAMGGLLRLEDEQLLAEQPHGLPGVPGQLHGYRPTRAAALTFHSEPWRT